MRLLRSRLELSSEDLRSTYWFLPGLITFIFAVAALITIQIDFAYDISLAQGVGDPSTLDGSAWATLISVLAGSIATIVGVVFSLNLVVLTLGSQQYGPLIVGNFIRDRGSQVVFGIYTGTFIFCVMVLVAFAVRTDVPFMPRFSAIGSIVLAVCCVLALIYFIHHMAVSIRPTSIIGNITMALLHNIESLSLEKDPDELPPAISQTSAVALNLLKQSGGEILAGGTGYVIGNEYRQLAELAKTRDVTLQVLARPGHFVIKGSIIGRAYPPENSDTDLHQKFQELIHISPHRSPMQDIELLFSQLVAIATRALSAAINDPFTAMTCIDHLGEALAKTSLRKLPSPYQYDDQGRLRLVSEVVTFAGLMHLSFDQVLHYGRGDLMVMVHMLNTIRKMGEVMHSRDEQRLLQRYAGVIWGEAKQIHTSEYARNTLSEAYHRACTHLLD